jgi:CheY-like chemotaxis protein
VVVLYADDDIDDKEWISEACKEINCSFDLKFVNNGKEVLEYLSCASNGTESSLIVLDLNMPELDGRQTLKTLKTNPTYQHIPVVIVSTSSNKLDKEICHRLGAALYLTKPVTHGEWKDIIRKLQAFTLNGH